MVIGRTGLINLIEDRRFALADLILAVASGVLIYAIPQAGWLAFLPALAPWGLRLAAARFPFRRTRLDLPLAIFWLTAIVGVWAAYNRQEGWAKFWLIAGSIIIYYALAGQPEENLWIVTGLIGAGSALIAIYFLSGALHPDNAAGGLAVLAPLLAAYEIQSWRKRQWIRLTGLALAGVLLLVSLALTRSVGAWIALGSAFGLWALWELCGLLAGNFREKFKANISQGALFTVFLTILIGFSILLASVYPSDLFVSAVGERRIDQYQASISLIGDFPFTGGGLRSFPGLYAHYIHGTPFTLVDQKHGHNLYLDAALEQGIVGGLALLGILLGSGWMLMNHSLKTEPLLSKAIFASLLILALYGLVDDALYGTRGLLFFFIPAGLSAAAVQDLSPARRHGATSLLQEIKIPAAIAAALTLLFLAIVYRRPLQAAWYANLGSVEMSRIELADFPSGKWDEGQYTTALASPERIFQAALQVAPDNRTANHRLGLIAMHRRDYSAAILFLERAYHKDPNHRGIRKALGYSYTWAGKQNQAVILLSGISEARQELIIYTGWWEARGRKDLSDNAALMIVGLDQARSNLQGP